MHRRGYTRVGAPRPACLVMSSVLLMSKAKHGLSVSTAITFTFPLVDTLPSIPGTRESLSKQTVTVFKMSI